VNIITWGLGGKALITWGYGNAILFGGGQQRRGRRTGGIQVVQELSVSDTIKEEPISDTVEVREIKTDYE